MFYFFHDANYQKIISIRNLHDHLTYLGAEKQRKRLKKS